MMNILPHALHIHDEYTLAHANVYFHMLTLTLMYKVP